ncbi:MAG: sigma-70 family RNA polymerase sigma factor [Tunicatimonas sp.]|uniref:RNA polymerase sigma factor n=1 Tax=Tunicatimonas sp. TaxID=1940096 RepID=UPI003C76A310
MEQPDDFTLWSEFRAGNHQAFSTIYSKFFPALYNYGEKFTAQPEIVEECVQQLFVELWQSREKLSNIHAIKPYLYKSFRRKLIRYLKQNTSYLQQPLQPVFAATVSREVEIMNAERSSFQAKLLNDALIKLSDRQREAIFLKFYDKLSYPEISKILDCEPKTAYDLVFKGVKKMRSVMPRKEIVLLSFATAILYLLISLLRIL